jgi:O-succinylbenzoate synthase
MKRLLRVLFIFVPFSIGAAELAAQDKLKETPYYPLKVGTTWHYRAGDSKFTIRVVRHEKVGEVLCALLETKRDGKVVGSEHLAVTADGVYRYDLTYQRAGSRSDEKKSAAYVSGSFRPPMLILKLPPKKGDSWKVDSKSDGQNFRGSFQVGAQEITVPAGVYKTFRVASQDLEVNALKPTITTFFAEGVGMVKQIISVGEAKIEIELEKLELGGK